MKREPGNEPDSLLRALTPGEQTDCVAGAEGEFGYQRTNPIPADGNWYCRRLRCPRGHPYWYHRLGSLGPGPDGHIVDAVELLCFGGESHIELFFDMYHAGASSMVPSGLAIAGEAGRGSTQGRALLFPEGLDEYEEALDGRRREDTSIQQPSVASGTLLPIRSKSNEVTVVRLSQEAGLVARLECERVGVPFVTPVQNALGSGLDVALTLMECSAGLFQGLETEAAQKCVAYFREEAARSEAVDVQIAIWYRAWATIIEAHFSE